LLADLSGAAGPVAFTGETHTGNPHRLTASCFRARQQLDWTPQVPLTQGLQRYVAWFVGQTGDGYTNKES